MEHQRRVPFRDVSKKERMQSGWAQEVAHNTALGRAYLDRVMAPRLATPERILERAKQRDEVRPRTLEIGAS